jgi:phosphoglycerate dehydrogenase-like enzyme
VSGTGAPLRLLLSEEAIGRHGPRIAQVLEGRAHELVHPGHAQAAAADVAFVSRDITGLSTKHQTLPDTQRAHDALRAAKHLRWLHIHSAGADRPIYQELHHRGVRVTTSSGANAGVVAQTALLGVLALARHWPALAQAQRDRRWAPLIAIGLPRDLQGQRALVVGWGPIGQAIGRLLQAIGIELVVVRQSARDAAPGVRTITTARLRDELPQADWLLLACPLTAQTRGLIGATELALLPPHAQLVNVSRGDVVDEPALIDALRAGRLAGAYLDVFAQEPLPPESPLWALPNVLLTPHSAGFSDGNEERVAEIFLENLARFVRGEALRNELPRS